MLWNGAFTDTSARRLRMEAFRRIGAFHGCVTQSNNTHKSVPIILSAASAENYGVLLRREKYRDRFQRGWFPYARDRQPETNDLDDRRFYREADTFIDMSAFNTGSTLTSLHDAAILPLSKEGTG